MSDLVQQMADTLDTDEAEAGRKANEGRLAREAAEAEAEKKAEEERAAREGSSAQPADEVSSFDNRRAMRRCRKRSLTGWSSANQSTRSSVLRG